MEQESLGAQIGLAYDLQTGYLAPRFRAMGLSWSTFQLLAAVQSVPGGVSQVEVARRLGVTPATLSETVFAHVQRGLLDQVPSSTDRRAEIEQCEAVMRNGLSDKEVAQLLGLLGRVATNLESSASNP